MSASKSVRLTKTADDILERVKKKTGCPKTVAIEKAVVHFWGGTIGLKRKSPPGG